MTAVAQVRTKKTVRKEDSDFSWERNFINPVVTSSNCLTYFLESKSPVTSLSASDTFANLFDKRASFKQTLFETMKVLPLSHYYIGISYLIEGDKDIHTKVFPQKDSPTYSKDKNGVVGTQIIPRIWNDFKQATVMCITLQEIINYAQTSTTFYYPAKTTIWIN